MSSPSDSDLEIDSWKVELEIALLEDADFLQIRKICGQRPIPANSRAEVWRLCLRPDACQVQSMTTFAEVFDLENQKRLNSDCEKFAHEVLKEMRSAGEATNTPPCTGNPSVGDAEDIDEFEDALELDSKGCPVSSDPQPTVAQLTSDFESVLTHFCQSYKLKYEPELGWLAILKTLYLVMKPTDRQDLYGCFSSFYHHFLPIGDDNVFRKVSAILRLLVQYHEPKLCNFLDSLNLPPEVYASSWCVNIFSQAVPHEVLISLWDIYFLTENPLLVFFMVLVLLKNVKSELLDQSDEQAGELSKSDEETATSKSADYCRDDVLERLRNMPSPMQVDDLPALFDLSQRFATSTPVSFKALCTRFLFTNNGDGLASSQTDTESAKDKSTCSDDIGTSLGSDLCLSISVQELLEAQEAAFHAAASTDKKSTAVEECAPSGCSSIRYLVVDSRPAQQYNAGHLSTAFFLDTSLMFTQPPQFQSTVQTLLQSQRRALVTGSPAAGEHIAILSSGRAEEMTTVNMVVAAFLRLNTPFVSIVRGGYISLHEALDGNTVTLNRWLVHHDPAECLSCRQLGDGKPTQPVSNQAADRLTAGDTQRMIAGRQYSVNNPFRLTGDSKLGDGFLSRVSGVFFNRTTAAPPPDTKDIRKPGTGKPTSQLHKVINKSTSPNKVTVAPAATQQPTPPQPHKKKVAYRNTPLVFTIDGDEADDDDEEIGEDFATTSTDSFTSASDTGKDGNSKAGCPTTTRSEFTWFKRLTSSVPAAADTVSSPDVSVGDIPVREEGLDNCQPGDLIDATRWSSRPEVRGVFVCRFVQSSGSLGESGFLVLVERHLLVMRVHRPAASNSLLSSLGSILSSAFNREQQQQSKRNSSAIAIDPKSTRHAEVLRSVPITLISRITANRRLPECITFHYNCQGRDAADRLLMTANHSAGLVDSFKDRLYLPDAGEAFRIIKMAIYTAVTGTKDSIGA